MNILATLFLVVFTSANFLNESTNPIYDYYEGIEISKKSNKPIFLFFTGRTCENPKLVNELVQNDNEIKSVLKEKFVPVILFVDDMTKLPRKKLVKRDGKEIIIRTKGNEWAHIEISKYNNNVQPLMIIVNSNEDILKPPLIGEVSKSNILDYLQ